MSGVLRGDASGTSFPQIADYGFLSDCETCALIAPSGSVEWLCLPRFDSPSIFGAILDRDAGMFRLGPDGVSVPAARRYLPGTMVLETSWAAGGWIIVRDVLLIGPWHHAGDRSNTHRRSPTDYDADHVLLRMVRCVNGQVQVNLDCEPAFGYGREAARWEYAGADYHTATARSEESGVTLQLTTDMRLGFEGPRAIGRTLMKEGETKFAALSWSEHAPPSTCEEAHERLVWTAHHWQHWLDHGEFPDHPWRTFLQRSALTLKGLSYAPTGALVAAATTSLPEVSGGERNWDYRYTWIRDSTFMLWALYSLGFDWEANDFFHFLIDVVEGEEGKLQIMYGIGGESELPEYTLDHLSGYNGARPVRVGNAAYHQDQHDVWGAILDSFYLHTKSRDQLPERVWPILVKQVESAIANWRDPDFGIWEVRGPARHFTSSKLMCWVAADRGARLAEIRGDLEYAVRWQTAADEIRDDICAYALDDRGVFCQHYDTTALDASVLLMPLVSFLSREDPRIRNTVLAIADELTIDGLVLRYRTAETDDGLTGDEGSFTICSFWLVSALVEIGEVARAHDLCEKLLSYASPLGLYAEEIDPRSGRHLGNFPQAFTHLALINAVLHVIAAEKGIPLASLQLDRELTEHSEAI
jgi:alpha,alpha-trehalase